jgi:hypothetical protein
MMTVAQCTTSRAMIRPTGPGQFATLLAKVDIGMATLLQTSSTSEWLLSGFAPIEAGEFVIGETCSR